MPSALVPLANITLGSSAATVTFSSISGSYRDLLLVAQPSSTSNLVGLRMRINSDTGSNYPQVVAFGDGSSAYSASNNDTYISLANGAAWTTTSNATVIVSLLDYSATDKHKPILERGNVIGTYPATVMSATRWASTSAITSIQLYFGSGNIAAGSTFALYGVSA